MFLKCARTLIANEEGSVAIEYGLIVALVSISIITMLTSFGDSLSFIFEAVVAAITGVFS